MAALVIWILLVPLAVAVVDLVRTTKAIAEGRKTRPPGGPWSQALHLGGG